MCQYWVAFKHKRIKKWGMTRMLGEIRRGMSTWYDMGTWWNKKGPIKHKRIKRYDMGA